MESLNWIIPHRVFLNKRKTRFFHQPARSIAPLSHALWIFPHGRLPPDGCHKDCVRTFPHLQVDAKETYIRKPRGPLGEVENEQVSNHLVVLSANRRSGLLCHF